MPFFRRQSRLQIFHRPGHTHSALQRERDELRVQLQSDGRSEQRERKHSQRLREAPRAIHQDMEDVPTKSFARAWMTVNSSSCCSQQRRFLHVGTDLFMMATMTALRKPDGSVRGITGNNIHQFAMSTRAGTDCVGNAIRATTDHNPRTTVLSIDGGAHHVLQRDAKQVARGGEPPRVVAFRLECFPSLGVPYHWQQKGRQQRQIRQCEGVEQGDPPCAFCSAWPCTTLSLRSRIICRKAK